jgi:hypothetical protein
VAEGFFGEGIDDTPPVAEANYVCNLNMNSCTNDSPDLPDQVENYMDYASGSCMNMFTLGQKGRMDGVLASNRTLIHSAGNLTVTGVDNLNPAACAPIAEFFAAQTFVCTGETVTYSDDSYNGVITSRSWEFPGGNPATSSAASPQVTYSQPGLYAARSPFPIQKARALPRAPSMSASSPALLTSTVFTFRKTLRALRTATSPSPISETAGKGQCGFHR